MSENRRLKSLSIFYSPYSYFPVIDALPSNPQTTIRNPQLTRLKPQLIPHIPQPAFYPVKFTPCSYRFALCTLPHVSHPGTQDTQLATPPLPYTPCAMLSALSLELYLLLAFTKLSAVPHPQRYLFCIKIFNQRDDKFSRYAGHLFKLGCGNLTMGF